MAQLADLFTKTNADVGFRTGVLETWDGGTGENTITVGGGLVTNVPVLVTTDLPALSVGDTVHLLRVRNQYVLLGSIYQPPF